MIREQILDKRIDGECFWGNAFLLGMVLWFGIGQPMAHGSEVGVEAMTDQEAVQLGEEFGVIVGKVDEEIQKHLGLTQAEGVVVFEVLGGKPADLAGIKSGTLITEINSVEIQTLEEFGTALKAAMKFDNFSLVTYAPADLDSQGVTGGINFHFVRVEKS